MLETDEEICFSDYAKLQVKQMLVENRERTAKNYKLAVAHLERYIGTTQEAAESAHIPSSQKDD